MKRFDFALIFKLIIVDFMAAFVGGLVIRLLFPDKMILQWIGVVLSVGIATAVVVSKNRKSGKREE